MAQRLLYNLIICATGEGGAYGDKESQWSASLAVRPTGVTEFTVSEEEVNGLGQLGPG